MTPPAPDSPKLARLAHVVSRYRWPVIGLWIVLTLVGGVAAGKLSNRWYQEFSVPGKSAYEAGNRALHSLGFGVRPPDVVVYRSRGDVSKSDAMWSSYVVTPSRRATSRRDSVLRTPTSALPSPGFA